MREVEKRGVGEREMMGGRRERYEKRNIVGGKGREE